MSRFLSFSQPFIRFNLVNTSIYRLRTIECGQVFRFAIGQRRCDWFHVHQNEIEHSVEKYAQFYGNQMKYHKYTERCEAYLQWN